MPFIRSKSTSNYGFVPYTGLPASCVVNPYAVSSSDAIGINAGDVVAMSSVAPTGGLPLVQPITGVWSTGIVGVAAHALAAGTGNKAASLTVATSAILMVYDDPDQLFYVNDFASSVGGGLASSAASFQTNILATGGVGSTGPNPSLARSVQTIGGLSTSAVLPLRVVGLHPIDTNTSSALGTQGRAWVVAINAGARTPAASQGGQTT